MFEDIAIQAVCSIGITMATNFGEGLSLLMVM